MAMRNREDDGMITKVAVSYTHLDVYKRQGQDLAANVRSTSSLIGHDALRGGNDCGAQALHDLRHILAVGVDAQAGLGHAAQARDNGLAVSLVLQGDNDGAPVSYTHLDVYKRQV